MGKKKRPQFKTIATYQTVEDALAAGKPLRVAIQEAAEVQGVSYEAAKARYFRCRRAPSTKK